MPRLTLVGLHVATPETDNRLGEMWSAYEDHRLNYRVEYLVWQILF
jgi:hypothetical protein